MEKTTKNITDAEMKKVTCGLVMPISNCDGCGSEHWGEVKSIIIDALKENDEHHFQVNMVSDSDDIGVIQKNIVQGLYDSDVVICDVSGKNPNVMFEMGMRLAFDKPTVIIKDDVTDFSFDTAVIEHLIYPRDLRFSKIVDFKEKLQRKVIATYKKATSGDGNSFLKSFGTFKVASLEEQTVSPNDFIVSTLTELAHEMKQMKNLYRRERDYSLDRHIYNNERDILPRILSKRTFSLIEEWCAKTGTEMNVKNLFGNSSFYEFMENALDAPKTFPSKDMFREALNDFLMRKLVG